MRTGCCIPFQHHLFVRDRFSGQPGRRFGTFTAPVRRHEIKIDHLIKSHRCIGNFPYGQAYMVSVTLGQWDAMDGG
ncbi:hypothetical protein D3C86_1940260 [compost metagenome]